MNLLILSKYEAIEHKPVNLTYLISIHSGYQPLNEGFDKISNALYKPHKYVFDDRSPWFGSGRLLTKDLARRIIEDFRQGRDGCADLLVHCHRGMNRSPAVAIALNELFSLGHNPEVLKCRFPEYTLWVYSVLKKVGQNLLGQNRRNT